MKNTANGLLIFLLLFNAIGAFYGGISFVSDPSGQRLKISTESLQGSPFSDFFIPGILLLLINGLLPLVAGLGLWFLKPNRALANTPILKDYHWAWSLALASGIGLMIWISVQILWLGYWSEVPIQAVFGILGLVITGLTLSPPVRQAALLKR